MAREIRYLCTDHVRQAVKAEGRRLGADFLYLLDRRVGELIASACATHNGGKMTLDREVAVHVGACPKGEHG